MGLLSLGVPLSWEETKKHRDDVKKHGILQFINIFNRLKDRKGDYLKFGDEIEGMLVEYDHENRKVRLKLSCTELIAKMKDTDCDLSESYMPEYAEYMLESIPREPYGHNIAHLNTVQHNMQERRQQVANFLGPNDSYVLLTTFPRLGCSDFSSPSHSPDPEYSCSKSLFFPDEAISQSHPRFKTLTRNIRSRRGEKINIQIPIYRDLNTLDPFWDPALGSEHPLSVQDHIYMDAMGFGMGNCCLQVTFQASSLFEARFLYDQLAPMCPVMLALSAACPIRKGYLSDVDCRWDTICAAVDCRTRQERGLEDKDNDAFLIHKSRFGSIDSYLTPANEHYNDIPLAYHQSDYATLLESGVDETLAKHVAHLFIRDPVVVYWEKLDQDDTKENDHFENIQSTNWQTLRFKPPPPGSPIGWRVEFRPLDVQMTDFENSAFSVFVILLTRAILSFKITLLIPMSKVEENMKRCQVRDAINVKRFYFRKDVIGDKCSGPSVETSFEEMDLDTIFNGKEGTFIGLIPIIRRYLDSGLDVDVDTMYSITQYLDLISKRASGQLMTTAGWIRKFVLDHEEYKRDSVVTDGICYDLVLTMDQIQKGQRDAKDLLLTTVDKSRKSLPEALLNSKSGI